MDRQKKRQGMCLQDATQQRPTIMQVSNSSHSVIKHVSASGICCVMCWTH